LVDQQWPGVSDSPVTFGFCPLATADIMLKLVHTRNFLSPFKTLRLPVLGQLVSKILGVMYSNKYIPILVCAPPEFWNLALPAVIAIAQ
jgi:hypothetical protein